jgi:micrococcal nuclease
MLKLCLLIGWGCTLSGVAVVHDGDTIRVAGASIRLAGIDAEELSEPNGAAATTAMQRIVGTEMITCVVSGKSYNRFVATCTREDGTDIGGELVRRGFALDCAHYSGGKYRGLEPVGARARLLQKFYCGVDR